MRPLGIHITGPEGKDGLQEAKVLINGLRVCGLQPFWVIEISVDVNYDCTS